MVEKECVVCGKIFDARNNCITCSKECRDERNKQRARQWSQNNKEKIQKYCQNRKEKKREYDKQYRQDNKEKIQKYKKQWYQDNKEKRKEYQKQYHQDNKEKRKEYQKKYYQDNKEKIQKQHKQYRQDNKEKDQKYRRQYSRQRYEQAYKDLSNKRNVSIDNLKKYIPPNFIKRELECWEQGSFFLNFIIPMYERANGRCEITDKKTNDLVVHHLNGYNWCVEGRMDWDNAVVICRELHDAFHKKYGKGNNTVEQFWEFVEEWEKGLVTLDYFYGGV